MMSKELIERVKPKLLAMEGSMRKGYVPNVAGAEQSGVTIAKGLDLGQYSYTDLTDNLKLPTSLANKLQPYLRHQGVDAKAVIANKPLVITPEEENIINEAVPRNELKKLKQNFEKTVGRPFEEEPLNVQEALLLASFNLGSDADKESLFTLKNGKPSNFRKQIINRQYEDAGKNLTTWSSNMADGLKKRRMTEGQLLSGDIDSDAFVDQLNVNLKTITQANDPIQEAVQAVQQPTMQDLRMMVERNNF